MLRLKSGQRRVLIDRLPELANLIVGSLFFGQFLTDRPFSWRLAVSSIALWIVFVAFTFALVAWEEP